MRVPYQATEIAAAYENIRRLPVSVLLDNVRSLYNVGAFVRGAEESSHVVKAAHVVEQHRDGQPSDVFVRSGDFCCLIGNPHLSFPILIIQCLDAATALLMKIRCYP